MGRAWFVAFVLAVASVQAARNSNLELDKISDVRADDAIIANVQKIKDFIQESVDHRQGSPNALKILEELKKEFFELLDAAKKDFLKEHNEMEKKYQALVRAETDERMKDSLRFQGEEEYDAHVVRFQEDVKNMEKQFADLCEELMKLAESGAEFKACGFNLCKGDTLECCEGKLGLGFRVCFSFWAPILLPAFIPNWYLIFPGLTDS